MISLNATPSPFSNRPKIGSGVLPNFALAISPWSAFDKYSDETTDTDGTAFPDPNNILYNTMSTSVYDGYATAQSNYLLSGTIYSKFFGFANRSLASNAFKYYKFQAWFNRYRKFQRLGYYPILNDLSKVHTSTATYLNGGGFIRALDSSTVLWVYDDSNTPHVVKGRVGTIASDGVITWGSATTLSTSTGITDVATHEAVVVVSSTKFGVLTKDSSAFLSLTLCTVSGTTITPGVQTLVAAEGVAYTNVDACTIGTDKIAIAWDRDDILKLVAVTISGTTPTFGAVISLITNGNAHASNVKANGTDAFVVSHTGTATTMNQVTACTVSGTTITAGTPVTWYTSGANATARGGYYENLILIATNTFLITFKNTNSLDGLVCSIVTISGTTPTVNTTYSVPYTSAGTGVSIWTNTAGSDYVIYDDALNATRITISGTVVTFVYYAQDVVTGASVLCSNVGAYPKIASPLAYAAPTYFGIGQVGTFIVSCGVISNLNGYYLTGIKTNTFEAYNNGTIIGSAFTATEPFVLQSQDINSAVYSDVAYLKIKNTSGAVRGMVIETVICEID